MRLYQIGQLTFTKKESKFTAVRDYEFLRFIQRKVPSDSPNRLRMQEELVIGPLDPYFSRQITVGKVSQPPETSRDRLQEMDLRDMLSFSEAQPTPSSQDAEVV